MRVLIVIGTRPEAIKMLPLVLEMRKYVEHEILVCNSGQHAELSKAVFDFFEITPDFQFQAMRKGQSLKDLTVRLLDYFDVLFDEISPDIVLTHGDTTTAFCASLVAFYKRIKLAHVEAGLRTYNKNSPFPEEFNRVAVDSMADLHFAPTRLSAKKLEKEGKNSVFTVGNTVIDALRYTVCDHYSSPILDEANGRKILLVTTHRRENIGEKMCSSLLAVREILEKRDDIFAIFPMHLNPAVRKLASEVFCNVKNIKLCEPLSLYDFHNLLARAYAVMTDSGGIQEEASFLGIPLFLLRDTTEREEGAECGNIRLVGADGERLKDEFFDFINDEEKQRKMRQKSTVFGDGCSCEQIAEIIFDTDF